MGESGLAQRIAQQTAEGRTVEEIYLDALTGGAAVAEIEAAITSTRSADHAGEMRTRTIRVVVVIGALLVGAGVFSFVAANWESMPDWLRIAVIVAGMVVFSASGWWLHSRRRFRITGEALLLLGSIVFGAGIFLVAQIFNIQGNWPDGFVMWMIGTLAMAAATGSIPLYTLGTVVGLVAVIGYPFTFLGPLPEQFNPFLLSSPLLMGIGAVAALLGGMLVRRSARGVLRDRW